MKTFELADLPHLAPDIARRCFAIEPIFYSLFSPNHEENLAGIERLLLDPRTDLGCNRVILEDGKLCGFFSFYDIRKAMSVQISTLKALRKTPSRRTDTRIRVKEFNAGVPPVREPSLYLSKIFVTEQFRGRGLARTMLAELYGLARTEDLHGVSLHVRADNAPALALYASEGFTVIDKSASYLVLLRREQTGA